MKWDLLFSDALARLLGLLCLAATGIWAVLFWRRFADLVEGPALTFPVGMALMSLAATGLFLLPGVHDRAIRLTFPRIGRVVFLPVVLACVLAVGLGVLFVGAMGPIVPDPRIGYGLVAAVLGLFAVLIAPGGLAYRDLRRELAARQATEAPHEEVYSPARNVAAAEASQPKRRSKAARAYQQGDRPSDLLDFIVGIPIIICLLGGLYAFRFQTTVQTADFDAWLDQRWIAGTVAALVVCYVPILLVNLVRGAPRNWMRRRGKSATFLSQIVAAPPMAFACFILAAYDLMPWAWNQFNDSPIATIEYRVSDIDTTRRLDGCTSLSPVSAPEQGMYVCNMAGGLISDLAVGDIIAATGPLSDYGHTIQSAQVVR